MEISLTEPDGLASDLKANTFSQNIQFHYSLRGAELIATVLGFGNNSERLCIAKTLTQSIKKTPDGRPSKRHLACLV